MTERLNSGWLRRIASPHRVGLRDVLFTLIPALLWLGGVYARPILIKPTCAGAEAAACTRASVLPIDQLGLGLESGPADGYSYATQNLSGFFAIGMTLAWHGSTIALRAVNPSVAAAAAGTDLLLLGQASAFTGSLNEMAHAATRRPRPFVYSDPATRGLDPSHYTSFYSGHTAFSAVAGMSLFLILLARGAPTWLLLTCGALSQSLVFLTGIFRVFAGRHFITDVVVASCIGALMTLLVFWLHKREA